MGSTMLYASHDAAKIWQELLTLSHAWDISAIETFVK